ncbi:MAG: outer membrane lipoprotein carrier protein LolA [Spirochaetales bacterium]|nr:outer membrane lipoprotein carrier protein LolA [Spirochaetales bacterium]
MKKILVITIMCCMFLPIILFAQEGMQNAQDIFNRVSDKYAKITDLQCNIRISKGDTVQAGRLFYTNKNYMKIEFSSPSGQIILIDREKLQIYLPSHRTILEQKFRDSKESLLTSGGLALFDSNYHIGFAVAGLTPLQSGSSEQVYKLRLEPNTSVTEGYKEIILSINPSTELIRRIEAITLKNEKITIDYDGITLNVGIPYTRFQMDPPNLTNVYPDFLSGSEE